MNRTAHVARTWLLLVLLVAVAAALAVSHHRHGGAEEAGREAREVVIGHVEELLSYDPSSVGADLDREAAWLTGDFASDYRSLVGDKIAPAARQGKVTTRAEVRASGVVEAAADEVELLLFVNVATSSPAVRTPQVVGSRVAVTAQRVDGEWRISSLRPL